MTSSSRPPEGNHDQPPVTTDQFFKKLTHTQKEILTRYLALDPNDTAGQTELIRHYGEVFTRPAFEVQQLVQAYGCGFDAIRRLLLDRLDKEGFNLTYCPGVDETRDSVSQLVDPYAPTEHSSSLPPDPALQAVLEALPALSPEQLQVLDDYCRANHDATDKTNQLAIPRIFFLMVERLKDRGVVLPTQQIRELLPKAIFIIRSKQR